MVTVKNFAKRQREDGTHFFVLILQGGLELVQSKSTGKFYATTRTTSIPTTFDEATCQLMVGQQLQDEIQKVECEPYDYTNPETGEVTTLTHTYQYVKEVATPSVVDDALVQ